MASLCFSPTSAAIVALKPLPSNYNQISFTNSTSFFRPLAFNPLRFSPISTPPRFSSIVAMASSDDRANEPLWKSLGKAFENFGKKPSVEDLLKQQIENQGYYEDGGDGNPPGGKGGGGGGGGGDDSGEYEEEGLLDEIIQVTLATLALIFVYVYIIKGPVLIVLAKDILILLFRGQKSSRLEEMSYVWKMVWKNWRPKKKEVDRYWLERAIINTPTWWDSPEKYMFLIKSLSAKKPSPDANDDMGDGYDSKPSPDADDDDDDDMGDGYDSQDGGEMSDEYY